AVGDVQRDVRWRRGSRSHALQVFALALHDLSFQETLVAQRLDCSPGVILKVAPAAEIKLRVRLNLVADPPSLPADDLIHIRYKVGIPRRFVLWRKPLLPFQAEAFRQQGLERLHPSGMTRQDTHTASSNSFDSEVTRDLDKVSLL